MMPMIDWQSPAPGESLKLEPMAWSRLEFPWKCLWKARQGLLAVHRLILDRSTRWKE